MSKRKEQQHARVSQCERVRKERYRCNISGIVMCPVYKINETSVFHQNYWIFVRPPFSACDMYKTE